MHLKTSASPWQETQSFCSIKLTPFQPGRKSFYHSMSALALAVRVLWWWSVFTDMRLRKIILSVGIPLATKDSLPIWDSFIVSSSSHPNYLEVPLVPPVCLGEHGILF